MPPTQNSMLTDSPRDRILAFLCCYLRQWYPTPVLLPGKSHGRRSLVGCSPWGCKELDTTEQLHFHFSLSCIGEGNGNPLQCSCLENPRDGGAWWAAVYGVAQSWTWLKRVSSSSSMPLSAGGWLLSQSSSVIICVSLGPHLALSHSMLTSAPPGVAAHHTAPGIGVLGFLYC